MRVTRSLLRTAVAIALCTLGGSVWSQTYPTKPIRLLVGFTAGGTADVAARVIAAKMAQSLGATIVVENRGGAAGSVAAQIVARAPADGYTLMLASPGALTVNRIIEKKLPYDPDTAFVPIGMAVTFCNALIARQDFPASTVAQLIALAKEKPGQLNFGSQGVGSAGFLSGQLMQQMAGIKLTHIPYKGGSDASTAVLARELELTFASATAAIAMRTRAKVLFPYDATFWLGLAAPAKTPQPIVKRLNALLREAVSDGEVQKSLLRQGLNPAPSSPQELTARMRADYVKWKRVLEGS